MRRCARTRFIPDDWGLKPPIETLPQIAQERAMRGPLEWSVGGSEPGGARTEAVRIAHGPRRSRRTPPDPPREEDVARVPDQTDARPIARDAPGRHRHRPRRDARLVRRHGVRRRPARAPARPRSGSPSPGSRVRLDDGLDVELDLTVASACPVAEVARQVDSAVRYAVRRALDREVRRLAIHIDGLARSGPAAPRRRSPTRTRRDPRPRDLADSGTDVA